MLVALITNPGCGEELPRAHVSLTGEADEGAAMFTPSMSLVLAVAGGEAVSLWAGSECTVQVSEVRLSS